MGSDFAPEVAKYPQISVRVYCVLAMQLFTARRSRAYICYARCPSVHSPSVRLHQNGWISGNERTPLDGLKTVVFPWNSNEVTWSGGGTTGWLKIKYPTRQCAISPQPVVRFYKFLKPFNPDTSLNPTLYNVSPHLSYTTTLPRKTITMKITIFHGIFLVTPK